ncbi:uncharacterized protein [Asterias amurensis]|uniref:uncharacterized protein n=1 Tax=Asterias amurensis TaxID=7602 RepID=UPI003AB4A95F
MKHLLSILVITVAVSVVSSRAVLPVLRDQGTFVRSNGMLKRVARDAESNLKSLMKTTAQDAECRYCEKLEELKKALLAIVERMTCPDEPEVPSDSYLSSNDIDLGIIDM